MLIFSRRAFLVSLCPELPNPNKQSLDSSLSLAGDPVVTFTKAQFGSVSS